LKRKNIYDIIKKKGEFMKKLINITKPLLKVLGVVCLFSIAYVFISLFIQKKAIENSDNGWDALGLVILFIYFGLPTAVLNLALAIYSFVFSSVVKKAEKNGNAIKLKIAIPFVVLTVISGVLLGINSFIAVYFEPVSLILGIIEVAVGALSLATAIIGKKPVANIKQDSDGDIGQQ
jgi:hypothetical protein